MATIVRMINDSEKNRVASPRTSATAPNSSKYVATFQLISGGSKFKGNGKLRSANQFCPMSFWYPASQYSQASRSLSINGGIIGERRSSTWLRYR